MIDPLTTRRLAYWSILIAIWLVVLFLKILPLDLTAGRWPAPDLVLAFAFAWALRRPDYVPTLLFALLMLISDFIFMRPPGLFAALTVIGLEFLRSRSQFSRDLPFLVEWAMVSSVFVALVLVNRIILAIFVVSQPNYALDMLQIGATVLFYPIAVAISSYILGIRKVAPGEVDQLGHRI